MVNLRKYITVYNTKYFITMKPSQDHKRTLIVALYRVKSLRTFIKSDRFQLPTGASLVTAGNLQFSQNGMQFFVVDVRGIGLHAGVALPRVLPSSVDFNQRGSVAKAGLCSNCRLSVAPTFI